MNAMIFAAGLGTRLRPLTNDRPKALVEVCGLPLLHHLILRLKTAGFHHIVINVHHFGKQVIDYVEAHDNFGVDVRISDERNRLLDTGGGIKHALSLFDDLSQPILIHNVDIVSNVDLRAFYESQATMLVQERSTSRYLLTDPATGLLRGWTNIQTGQVKNDVDPKQCNLRAFSGIHVMRPDLFSLLQQVEEEVFPIMDFYLDVCRHHPVQTLDLSSDIPWVDCGKPESLVRAAEIIRSL